MAIQYCHVCQADPQAGRRYGRDALAEGQLCPICYQPACRYHLTTVRWRWRGSGAVEAARVCRSCQRSYRHRDWDAFNREWIS